MSPMLEAALDLAERGWPVFPCLPGRKEPRTVHGFLDATTDPGTIERWWSVYPVDNLAVATGAPGPTVLDVDVRPEGNGFKALALLAQSGLLAGAFAIVSTPSGGQHWYFQGSDQGCRRYSKHFLDLKSRGGYVLVPPSVVNGAAYALLERREHAGTLDMAKIAALLAPAPPRQRHFGNGNGDCAGLVKFVAAQEPGNRNSSLFWAACKALESRAGDDVLDQLQAAAITTGLSELEARRTIRSARQRIGGAE